MAVEAPSEKRTPTGLIIPPHLEGVKVAIVESVGFGLALEALGLSPGDVIYYLEESEHQIKDKLIIEAHYIIAIETFGE